MLTLPRLTHAALIAGLMLTGCTHQQATRPTATSSTAKSSTATSSPASISSTAASSSKPHKSQVATSNKQPPLPDHTGIAACDDYLSSYLACHRAAAIYTPDQLQPRYQAMRTNLLRDSLNPDIRPQLAARCNSLASQLRDALHGKSCAENPAPASTTP